MPLPRTAREARIAALGAIVVAVLASLAVVALEAGGGGGGIAEAGARLVPANALVYVHVSTDQDRDAVKRAEALARRFPGYTRLRDGILRRLTPGSTGASGVSSWLGPEAGLALTDSASGTAGSLVLLAVRDEGGARAFVARGGGRPAGSYRGVPIEALGEVRAAFVGGELVLGQMQTVRGAIDLAQGRGRSLASVPRYLRALSTLPSDRVLDAYATAGGVRRLLAPAGGLLGLAGTLLDRPGLQAAAVSLSADQPGAVVVAHTLAAPGSQGAFRSFHPTLADVVPPGVLGYLGVRGLNRAIARLPLAAGGQASGLAEVLAAVRAAVGAHPSPQVLADLVAPLAGEAALVAGYRAPAPVLTVIARTPDAAGSRAAIDSLAAPLSRQLRDLQAGHATVAGQRVATFRVGGALEVDAAAFDGLLVLSTARSGIAAVASRNGSLSHTGAYRAVVGEPPDTVSTLAFLDFQQLLKLGEQTGLGASSAFQAVRDDLQQVSALGAVSTGSGGDTTAEVRFQIP